MRFFVALALGALAIGCGGYNRPMDGTAPIPRIAEPAPVAVDDKPQCDALRASILAGAAHKDVNDSIQAMQRLNCPEIPKFVRP
jgi:hypothetical protein